MASLCPLSAAFFNHSEANSLFWIVPSWCDEKTVKCYIRQGLENVLKEQPNRKIEIEKIFNKYNL